MWETACRRLMAAALLAFAVAGGCGRPAAAPRHVSLVFATGPKGAVFNPFGSALARIFNARIPGIQVRAEATPGGVFNVDAVQKGRADLAFAQGDPAYSAFRHGTPSDPRPHTELRAMAVLHTSALQIVVRRDGPIRSVAGLRGRRVGMGPAGSGTEVAARIVMEAHGLRTSEIEPRYAAFDEAARLLIEGQLDANFVLASTPADAISAANQSIGIRLLSVAPGRIRFIRERHSFYRPATIPRESYPGYASDVQTLAVDNLLVCRAGLDEELVRRLTAVLLESISELAKVHAAAFGIDPEAAPATPIPLHPGAARFYRERELLR